VYPREKAVWKKRGSELSFGAFGTSPRNIFSYGMR